MQTKAEQHESKQLLEEHAVTGRRPDQRADAHSSVARRYRDIANSGRRTNARKNHHHAHVWTARGDLDNARVEGHVVTAKGVGADERKRNLTKIAIDGMKDDSDNWTVASRTTESRLELPEGSPQVPLANHEEEELLVRGNLENAVHHLLNTPDEALGIVSNGADKIAARASKRLRQKNARKLARQAALIVPDDEDDMGFDIFDESPSTGL